MLSNSRLVGLALLLLLLAILDGCRYEVEWIIRMGRGDWELLGTTVQLDVSEVLEVKDGTLQKNSIAVVRFPGFAEPQIVLGDWLQTGEEPNTGLPIFGTFEVHHFWRRKELLEFGAAVF